MLDARPPLDVRLVVADPFSRSVVVDDLDGPDHVTSEPHWVRVVGTV